MPGVADNLLEKLVLPSRYEVLSREIGPEVVRLLHPPTPATLHSLEDAAAAINSMGEGLFAPLFAESGTGKTTLAENVGVFATSQFTKTLPYKGNINAREMESTLKTFVRDELVANESRVIPINIDDREGNPATGAELAEIKRFLRSEIGSRSLILWPETDEQRAVDLAHAYRVVAGELPIEIPLRPEGPPKEVWGQLAEQVLLLANEVDSLELLVDMSAYVPDEFQTMGDYLRRVSRDFNAKKAEIRRATVKPIALTIVFASQTPGHGVLSTLTSSRRFGMLDPSALIEACSGTVVGRWWNDHRGLLVQTIVALDAHVVSAAPTMSLAVWRKYAPAASTTVLADLGVTPRSPADVESYIGRSDLGRRLDGQIRSINETRGNPALDAQVAFGLYAEHVGFGGAKDKELNKAFKSALEYRYASREAPPQVHAETGLPFLPSLIPDISIVSGEDAHCLEFTYRSGDFLSTSKRSAVAKYCLEKLQNYARELGWISS